MQLADRQSYEISSPQVGRAQLISLLIGKGEEKNA